MRISVKNPKSGDKWTLQQVDPTASLQELHALVISVTGISNFELKVGFPPSTLGGSRISDSIRNGDQILIFPSLDTLNSKSTLIVKSTLDTSAQSTLNTGTTSIARNDNDISTNKDNIKSEKLQDGFLVIREMKDDNSCLFRSIAYVLERNVELHSKQRQIVRDYILENPIEYPKVILGRDPIEYCNWITNLNSWGGGIELAIFSEYYKTGLEIDSIDISTLRVDRFGQDKYDSRVLLLYSGIHYDVLAISPLQDGPKDFDVTVFSSFKTEILDAALRLASRLKEKHKYTDLANFSLRCGICRMGLIGQNEAQKHAMETGHAEFTEYSA